MPMWSRARRTRSRSTARRKKRLDAAWRAIRPRQFLFVCSRNRWRSPTAEAIFASRPGIVTLSAGLAPDAEEVLSVDHIEWADRIFVMEAMHRRRLLRAFGKTVGDTPVTVLGIRDAYRAMDPALIALLERKMRPYIR